MMREIDRRNFFRSSAAGLTGWAAVPEVSALASSLPAPYRTIYSNDTTNILSCQRPEERSKEFSEHLLIASIAEARGVDAHFLQPGLGWIPWWDSTVYSVEEHCRWLRDQFGIKGVKKIERFVLEGGDLLRTLVSTCRDIGVAPFLSFRLNDGHHVRDLKEALERGKPTQSMARHYWENYERFRIGPDPTRWEQGVFDWTFPEVRDYKFALLEEACSRYDLAGVELDFLRHWSRFGESVPRDKRFEITTSFVQRVRAMLDRIEKERGGSRRWLCVRVPANAEVRPDQGVDLRSLADAGVDMINLSYSYFTWQDGSVERARAEVGSGAAIYPEMTHTTMTGRATSGSGTQPFLRTTDQQFYTTARLAYEQGASGVSLFNFPYYRYHVTDSIGPFHEPPFHVLPRLADREFLKEQSSWYFLSSGRRDPVLGERVLPAILDRNISSRFSLRMDSPGQPRKDGVLRLRSDETISDRTIEVRVNGVKLEPVEPIRKPLPHPYGETWIGKREELACYSFPASLAIRETNQIEIVVRKGIRVRLIYLDVTIPGDPLESVA